MYMSPEGMKYNDVPVKYEQKHLDMLLAAGKFSYVGEDFFAKEKVIWVWF